MNTFPDFGKKRKERYYARIRSDAVNIFRRGITLRHTRTASIREREILMAVF